MNIWHQKMTNGSRDKRKHRTRDLKFVGVGFEARFEALMMAARK
jgi:hypothetical protein